MSLKSNLLVRFVVFGIAMSAVLLMLSACAKQGAAEWPQWRGPNRDGISVETDWDPEALAGGPNVLWHSVIGIGHSNVAIKNGRLYVMARNKNGESVVCLDADNGKEIWQHKTGERKIPEATPAVDGKYLNALTRDGILLCLKVKNGELVWRKNLVEERGASKSAYGYGTSPVVEGALVIINTKHSGI